MASMPGYHISKAPFAFLDQQFDGTNPANYTAALDTMKDSLVNVARNKFPGNPGKVKHFEDHWLGRGPWTQLLVEETLRAGLTEAIKTAAADPAHPKPMEFFWICAREKAFHIYYTDGPRQVTVFIFTPPPVDPIPDDLSGLTQAQNLYVVKKKDWELKPPGSNYPGTPTTLVPGSPDIIKVQIYDDPR